jgi:hypothetical protein
LNNAKSGVQLFFQSGVQMMYDHLFAAIFFNMLTRLNRLLLLAFMAMQLQSLFSQTSADTSRCTRFSCCNTDLTPAGVMISHIHNKQEWMLSYRFMNMYMSELATGTTSTTKDEVFNNYLMAPEKMSMQMHMLMGMYGITNRLTVMAMFNYQVNSMEMSMYSVSGHVHPGSHADGSLMHTMQTNGIGDFKFHVLYGIIEKENCQLLVSMGVSVPTGSIYRSGAAEDAMYPNAHYPYGMQIGSGTIDVLPSISYLHQKNKLALSVSVSGTYRGGYNSLGYRLGNEATVNGWMAYQWFRLVSSSIRLQGSITGEIAGTDPTLYSRMEPAANAFNYGGKNISAYAGSTLHFKGALKNNRLGIECGMPVYQDLNGIQLKQHLTLNAIWSFSF